MKRAYTTLLRLYPRDYRALFANEMLTAFEVTTEECRAGGRAYIRFALAELAGLVIGAASEWIAKLTTDPSIRGRSLPDRLMMRPPGVPWESFYAGAFLSTSQSSLPVEVREAEAQTEFLVDRVVYAISHHQFEKARCYSDEEREARENLRLLRRKYNLAE